MEDPYEVLGVGAEATAEEIRSAYLAGAKRFHPDAIGAEASDEAMRRLNLAYELLRDPARRAEYDATRPPARTVFSDVDELVRVWAEEAPPGALAQEKIAALNRERVRLEQEGWKVERHHDHLVATKTERHGLLARPRKRRVTVNIDRDGRAFRVEQKRPA